MNKSEFVKDFSEFYEEIHSRIDATVEQATTLYAIYRKDLRTELMKGKRSIKVESNGGQPATEKQKQFLMDLAYKKGFCITQTELDRMTREQASKTIDAFLEGD